MNTSVNARGLAAATAMVVGVLGVTGCTVVLETPFSADSGNQSTRTPDSTTAPDSPLAVPTPTSPSQPTPSVPAPDSGSRGTDATGGCSIAIDEGASSNAEMDALAHELFNSLTCNGDVPVEQQLVSRASDPDFLGRAVAAGAAVSVDDSPGSYGGMDFTAIVTIFDTRDLESAGMCGVFTAPDPLDARLPPGKALMCEDVNPSSPAPTAPSETLPSGTTNTV